MNRSHAITDDDLQAYADGALGSARRAEVAMYLDSNVDAARRVNDVAAQNEALRAAAMEFLKSDVPESMKVARLFKRRIEGGGVFRQSVQARMRVAAALAGVFLLGGGVGWAAHPAVIQSSHGFRPLVEEAADAYAVYEPDRLHPVEINATHRDDLMNWVTGRLRRSVSAPDKIANYRLLGGRVVATSRGPTAMFMYDDDHGKRLVMMVCPLSLHGTASIADRKLDGLSGVSWADRGVGYSIVGSISLAELHSLGEAVRGESADKT